MTSTAPSGGSDPAPNGGLVRRFTSAERWAHRTTATLMSVCIVTAAVLYNDSMATRVGHRHLVELVHVYCGFALPVPIVLSLASAAYRSDLRRLGRFTPSDWRWLRSRTRRDGKIRVGKFNAGQKLNASLAGGSILVLLGTGTVMDVIGLVPLSWRTGATFVHDWFALGVGLLVCGHITFALRDPIARQGMRTGWVPRPWARAEHARWSDTTDSAPASDGRPARTERSGGSGGS